jgi:hypothetical protein
LGWKKAKAPGSWIAGCANTGVAIAVIRSAAVSVGMDLIIGDDPFLL